MCIIGVFPFSGYVGCVWLKIKKKIQKITQIKRKNSKVNNNAEYYVKFKTVEKFLKKFTIIRYKPKTLRNSFKS
jgi:hypothetical protein